MNANDFDLRFLEPSQIAAGSQWMARVYHADPSVVVFIPLDNEAERVRLLCRFFSRIALVGY